MLLKSKATLPTRLSSAHAMPEKSMALAAEDDITFSGLRADVWVFDSSENPKEISDLVDNASPLADADGIVKLVAGEEATEEHGPRALENVDEGELPACEDDLERLLEERVSMWIYRGLFALEPKPVWEGLPDDTELLWCVNGTPDRCEEALAPRDPVYIGRGAMLGAESDPGGGAAG
ncbi:hypothetical protein J7T55_000896 [Diaporthe amygdali]|uniref:uncharacterized protein n=1 Tax=Phomopsis amygdali TaxID=1214568 RepID=UPI0022FF2D8E|nr:uncharacterized protein J7T55_000896 [Diaporthe amygdali]KAJ0120043.1 hypothetical protein J7T55_000896 [Diaporthe amygdali]